MTWITERKRFFATIVHALTSNDGYKGHGSLNRNTPFLPVQRTYTSLDRTFNDDNATYVL
jgi:hypothetical protein